MRALPKRKQTLMPAGIDNAPPDAKARWKAHAWRYPPYQYRREFSFARRGQGVKAAQLRVATATEREVLMFLGRDHTRLCINPVAAKADPQALEDARCCLVGNSFHAGVVALLIAPMLVEEGFLSGVPTPDELIARMGLLPEWSMPRASIAR